MSKATVIVIIVAIVVLMLSITRLAFYFGILPIHEVAVDIPDDDDDDEYPYDDDENDPFYDDDEEAVEVLPEYLAVDIPESQVAVDIPESQVAVDTPPISFEFAVKFAVAFSEEMILADYERMRHFAPRLFSPNWLQETEADFSQWAVEMWGVVNAS